MDYTAKGQTVGLAARIEQVSEVGRVYVSETVASKLRGWFRFEDLGEFALKGLDGPARIFELLGVGALRSRIEVARARGFSRFVGRDAETALLDAALERVTAGVGEVVGVVAEAGTGKSRLCLEFTERCRSRGVAIHRAHAVSHGKGLPFLPILELLRSAFDIADGETAERARQKIAGALVLLDREFEAMLPSVFEFMGVLEPGAEAPPVSPADRQRQLLEILLRIFTEPQLREPVVILVEDLHWIDPGSEVLLAKLAAAVRGARILLLLNYRPEHHPSWLRSSFFGQIALAPLDALSARELLHDLLGTHPSLGELSVLVGKRTSGNPFFVEEVVWSLIEGGSLTGSRGDYRLVAPLEQIAIPDSVQEVIAARIDRLPEASKKLLQIAAVIGRSFSEALLERVSETSEPDLRSALEELAAAELIHPEAALSGADYAFKHPLTREVAYHSQLADRRRRVHRKVAGAIATLEDDRVEGGAALLAHHWEAAGEALEAARWYSRAAESAGYIDPTGSLYHWDKVRQLARQIATPGRSGTGPAAYGADSAECDDLILRACWSVLDVGGRAGISTAEAEKIFDEGRRLAVRRGDVRSQVRLHSGWAARLGWSGDREAQRRHLLEADRLAEDLDELEVRLVVLQRRFVFEFHGGDMRSALALAELGIDQVEASSSFAKQHTYEYQRLLLSRATALAQLGRLEASSETIARADRLAPEGGKIGWEQNAHTRALICASQSLYRGDIDQSLRDALAFVALAKQSGSSWAAPTSNLSLGRAHLLGERFAEAREALARALALSREADLGLDSESATLACLAEAQAGCGEPEAAAATAGEAVSVAERAGTRFWELHAQLALAFVQLRAPGTLQREGIAAALERAAGLLEETGGAVMAPMLALRRAEFRAQTGDEAGRLREQRLALTGFEQMGATAHAARLSRQLEAR
jgi:adenylate cyclase